MKFATIDDFHEYVTSLQRRPVNDVGEVVPSDDELKEACEYLALRLQMLRNDILGLRGIEWVIFAWIMPENCAFPRFPALRDRSEIAMIFPWQEPGDEGGGCGMRIASPVFGRSRR
jgi:hypothetical protein